MESRVARLANPTSLITEAVLRSESCARARGASLETVVRSAKFRDADAMMSSVHSLIPELQGSPLLQRELALYRQHCACTQRVQQRARLLHERLDRVIVFDLRFRWWGLGNNLVRWLTLLRLGLATGRATFLWFSADEGRTRLFRTTPRRFWAAWRRACLALGYYPGPLHSLRHCGPSFDMLEHDGGPAYRTERQAQTRGRWANSKSVLRYSKTHAYLTALAQVPAALEPVALVLVGVDDL